MLRAILAYCVIGLVAGAIGKLIMPGKQGHGWLETMLVGIAGAMLGEFLAAVLFHVKLRHILSWSTLLAAVVGTLILLSVQVLVKRSVNTPVGP